MAATCDLPCFYMCCVWPVGKREVSASLVRVEAKGVWPIGGKIQDPGRPGVSARGALGDGRAPARPTRHEHESSKDLPNLSY